eukprot:COSAG01_NODE_1_length_100484_cov_170.446142_68_plen_125_part_00
MARLSGVNLPKEKQLWIALTYIYGLGITTSKRILKELKIDDTMKVKDLEENQIVLLRNKISDFLVEGDLQRKVRQDISRLKQIASFRGSRHKRNLPCRGQRTHTNARTRRGKKVAVAGKKKVTK